MPETLHVSPSPADYQELVPLLDSLADEVGEHKSHPLAPLMGVVGVLIEKYAEEYVPELGG